MDLPTCPACGQSVLDDDAEDCPFCGASMSGKPSAKPSVPAAAPQQQTATDGKPSPTAKKKTKPTQAAPAASSTDEDDPFSVDTTVAQRAVALHRKPAKGRMHKIVCPMCDTPGFTSTKTAGRDVRCANPECLVPVFTAPRLERSDESDGKKTAPVEKPRRSAGLLAGVAVLVLAIFGGVVWFFAINDKPPNQPIDIPITDLNPNAPKTGIDGADTNGTNTPDGADAKPTTKSKDDGRAKSPKVAMTELRDRAFAAMIEASLSRERNRSRPFCRRLTAEAYAGIGDLKGAAEQLERIEKVQPYLPYYRITPLVAVAWSQLDAGDSAAARQSLDQALADANSLLELGRYAFDASTKLAAALVADGRNQQARDLLDKHKVEHSLGQLLTSLTIANSLRSFDFDAEANAAPVQKWKAPNWVAVTVHLATRGYSQQAFDWAKSAADPEIQGDCISAWAESTAKRSIAKKELVNLDNIESRTQQLPAAVRAKSLARVAGVLLASANRTLAEQALAEAQASMQPVAISKPLAMPTSKQLADAFPPELPNPIPLQMSAVAAAEIARIETQLQRPKQAWQWLAKSLDYARGISPGPIVTSQTFDQIAKRGVANITAQLKNLLELENDDMARRALNRYRKQCRIYRDTALARFQLQTDLLRRAIAQSPGAADLERLDAIWGEVQTRSTSSDSPHLLEPYFTTSVPSVLAARYRAAGADERAKQIETAVGTSIVADQRDAIARMAFKRAAAGDVQATAETVRGFSATDDEAKQWNFALRHRLACQFVNRDQFERAIQFVSAFEDPLWREDAFALIAALASRKGQAATMFRLIEAANLTATEQVASFSGLVAGLPE